MTIDLAKSQIMTSSLDDDMTEWIPVATIDQRTVLRLQSGPITLNIAESALANNLDTWKGGYVNINHDKDAGVKRFKIEDAKFSDGMLYHKVSKDAAAFIRQSASSGRSIEIQPLNIEDNKITSYNGLGLSVLFPPFNPACNSEMGCSSLLDENPSAIKRIFSTLAEKFRSNSFIDEMSEGSETDRINNLEVNDMEASEIIKLTSALADAEGSQKESAKEIAELKSTLAERDVTVKDQTDKLEAMTKKLEEYTKAEAETAEKLKEEQWTKLESSIPEGKVSKPEDKEALKKEFFDDPAGFNLKMVSFIVDRELPRGESGSEHESSDADSTEAEDFKILDMMED